MVMGALTKKAPLKANDDRVRSIYICSSRGQTKKKRSVRKQRIRPWTSWRLDWILPGSQHQRRERKEEMVPSVGSQPSNGASRAYRKSFLKGVFGKCMAAGVVTGGCGRLSWDVGTLERDQGAGKYLDSFESRGLHLFKL